MLTNGQWQKNKMPLLTFAIKFHRLFQQNTSADPGVGASYAHPFI
jgi:hypothetical protein